ncbi:alkaline phosphatase family protein [Kordiimonas pumila]|uniref:Alkaline phosphatase family protein n=1 Tax=Kordiimonas pumila TaxID=2161677 RepID=A0ABV7D8M3_9PROT|nr:alkaline phosphatase family protein [Kordiimonas pumila]
MRIVFVLFLGFTGFMHTLAASETQTETVILVTIDGVRWQEVFTGVDQAFFDQDAYIAYKKHHADFKEQYGAETPNARRTALMPFLWDVVAKEGQLYGNRNKGSVGTLTNPYHFSYPGYSEILTGITDDRINSNDKVLNPNKTVLEWLNEKPENTGKIEAFASWDVFPYIINSERSHVPVNAGFEPYKLPGNKKVAFLNEMLAAVPSPWDTVRFDAFTMGYARAALVSKKMRFIYISLGETDDFAHDGHYDQYVNALHRSDAMLADLWAWLQKDPRYKDHTTLLVTTDHGRGSDSFETWKHHGRFPYVKEDGTKAVSDFAGDDQIWMAVIGPDTPAMGEVTGGPPVALNEVAATAAKFLGYSYESDNPVMKAGKPIESMMNK